MFKHKNHFSWGGGQTVAKSDNSIVPTQMAINSNGSGREVNLPGFGDA